MVKEGEDVQLMIIRIDAERHRLGLSLKQARELADRASETTPETEEEQSAETDALEKEEGNGMAHKVPSAKLDNVVSGSEGEDAQGQDRERRSREEADAEMEPAEKSKPMAKAGDEIQADATASVVLGTK